MPANQRRGTGPKHISVPMGSNIYSYTETGEIKYITIQYWNGGIYMSFVNRITDENVEEISFRMPEHVIDGFHNVLRNIMSNRMKAYKEGLEYEDISIQYPIGVFKDDKTILDGFIEIYTKEINGVKRIVIKARRDSIEIPIIFNSEYVIFDISPEKQKELTYFDIYDTKLISLINAFETSKSSMYRAIYNTAEQMIKAFAALLDEKLSNNKKPFRSNFQSYDKNYKRPEQKQTETISDDEVPF